MKSFFPVSRQLRTSQEMSLYPLPFTSVQTHTDRRSAVAAGELEGKASPLPPKAGQARLTSPQDFAPDQDLPSSLLCFPSPEVLRGKEKR